ncbi:MAG: hypothetical protein QOD87_2481 [Pseudonocardiales bacterium]|nr:hypothetical protein [Pseudonocardiales bacterium]
MAVPLGDGRPPDVVVAVLVAGELSVGDGAGLAAGEMPLDDTDGRAESEADGVGPGEYVPNAVPLSRSMTDRSSPRASIATSAKNPCGAAAMNWATVQDEPAGGQIDPADTMDTLAASPAV